MEEKIYKIYDCPFNELKAKKENASIVISILKIIRQELISVQDALDLLEDSKKILIQITKV